MFRLADNVILPANAPTQTFAFLGTRGCGKSYGAGVMVEAFLDAGVQVVVVDPVGIWPGLRIAADGKGRGFDIPVLGGWHGDVPLEPSAGEYVGQLAGERRMSLVLDVSEFTDSAQRRFVEAFCRSLFESKKRNRSPVHVLFEEGHEFFPQYVDAGAASMVGATKRLWKVGRNFGIGGTIVSQRAAEVNKGAINLSDVIVTGQLKAPNDVKTIAAWTNANGVDDKAIESLPKLPKGTLIVWTEAGAATTRFRAKRTFDTSRTPEAGDEAAGQALPVIDLAQIRTAMAATIEEAKANDPKALRDEIAALKRRIAESPGADMVGALSADAIHQAAEVERLKGELAAFQGATPTEVLRLRAMETRFDQVLAAVDGYRSDGGGRYARVDYSKAAPAATEPVPPRPPTPPQPSPPRAERTPDGSESSADGATRMLRALAARHPTPLTQSQVATLSGLKRTGGSFRTYLSRLVVAGSVTRDGDFLRLTVAGLRGAGPVTRPHSPPDLLRMWREKLPGKAADMLEYLATVKVLTKQDLAQHTGLDLNGGTFRTYLSKLSANGLIRRDRGGLSVVESLRLA